MVGVSIRPLAVLMIVAVEVSLVALSIVLPLVSSFDSPNPGLTGIILCMSLVNLLGNLLDSIWSINWCGPWIGTWHFSIPLTL